MQAQGKITGKNTSASFLTVLAKENDEGNWCSSYLVCVKYSKQKKDDNNIWKEHASSFVSFLVERNGNPLTNFNKNWARLLRVFS